MTADLYAAARAGLFSTLAGIGVIESGTWVGFEPEDADTILAALDAPARAALLAWLLPEDRLAAALHTAIPHWEGHKPETPAHHAIHVEHAGTLLAALTDPATDGGVK